LTDHALALGWAAPAHRFVQACHLLFGLPLPAGTLERLAGTRETDQERLMALNDAPLPPKVRWMARKLAQASWSQRALLIASQLFPTPRYIVQQYHLTSPWLLPLGYTKRWLAIISQGSAALRTTLRRGRRG
jgi:hypothetical protein